MSLEQIPLAPIGAALAAPFFPLANRYSLLFKMSAINAFETPVRQPLSKLKENSPDSMISEDLRDIPNPMSPQYPESLASQASPKPSVSGSSDSPKSLVASDGPATPKLTVKASPGEMAAPPLALEDVIISSADRFTRPPSPLVGTAEASTVVAESVAPNGSVAANVSGTVEVTTAEVSDTVEVPTLNAVQPHASGALPFGQVKETMFPVKSTTQDGTPIIFVSSDESRFKLNINGQGADRDFGPEKYYPGNVEVDIPARQAALVRDYTIRPGIRVLNGVGPYRLADLFGQGCSGSVYQARHAFTGEVVAVKLIKKDSLWYNESYFSTNGNPGGWVEKAKRTNKKIPWFLYREICMLKLVHCHPNIIKLKDVWDSKDTM